jgi:RHS repeat-associated protein
MRSKAISEFARIGRIQVTRTNSAIVWLMMCSLGAFGFVLPAGAQTSPGAYLTGYRYQPGSDVLVGTISPAPTGAGNFPATRYTYDPNGRLQAVESGYLASWQPDTVQPANWSGFCVAKKTTYAYDAEGHKVQETVTGYQSCSPAGATNVTQFAYDAYDRLICTAVRMTPTGSFPASACTGTQGVTIPDRITTTTYDLLNRVTQIRKAVGTASEEAYATYSYTTLDGLLLYIIDADGNRTTLGHDGFDRLSSYEFPSPTGPSSFNPATVTTALSTAGASNASDYEAYGYDNNGNRTSLRKRDSEMIHYQPDALNRISLKTVPTASQDVSYGYDLRGLMTYAHFGSPSGAGITNVYDGFGRMTSTTNSMGSTALTVGQGFDADGDRTTVTDPDGNYFQYDYDGDDRLSDIRENGGTVIVSENYYPIGLPSGEVRGGVTSSYDYDSAERPQTWTDTFISSPADLTTTLIYNPANQIITRTLSNDTYDYSGYVHGTTGYTPNGLNQYASVAGSSFTYDPNGNLKTDPTTQTSYSYDVENRLTTVSGSHTATLIYDPLGRLFQIATPSGTTQFFYDGDQLVAEYNASGTLLQRYVHGPGSDEPLIWYSGATVSSATRHSLQTNYQGSVDSVADASGNETAINTYDEYGRPAAGNVGRFQYTGQAWMPELGLYYYKARMYDPRLGRFLQTDPVGYKDDLDLYAYVGNDPMNRVDPLGLSGCGDEKKQGLSGHCLQASNFMASKDSNKTVVSTRKIDKAMIAAAPSIETTSRDKPEEKVVAFIQNTDGSVTTTPAKSKTKIVGNVYQTRAEIPKDAAAIEHSHPDDTSTLQPGPHDSAVVLAGKPNGITNNGRVGVLEESGGQFRFRVLSGTLADGESDMIQDALNRFQQNAGN